MTDAAMPHVTRLDGTQIHYELTGPERDARLPILLLAPGGIDSSSGAWADARMDLSWLSEERLIIVDQRFAGESSTHLSGFDHRAMAEDVLGLLDELTIRRVLVIGEGMGALQALRLAYDAPARIAGVLAVAPFARPASLDELYAPFAETVRLARADGMDAVLAAAEAGGTFADNPAAGPWINRLSKDAGFRAAVRRLGREAYITHVVDFRDGLYPWTDTYFALSDVAVERIRLPVAVAAGDDVAAASDLCERTHGTAIELTRDSVLAFLGAHGQADD